VGHRFETYGAHARGLSHERLLRPPRDRAEIDRRFGRERRLQRFYIGGVGTSRFDRRAAHERCDVGGVLGSIGGLARGKHG